MMGRPKGSTNRRSMEKRSSDMKKHKQQKQQAQPKQQEERAKLECVDEVPARCPRCGSFARDLSGSHARPKTMMKMRDGTLHLGFMVRYARCVDCRHRYTVKVPIFEKSEISSI